jgi:hypothetical protein
MDRHESLMVAIAGIALIMYAYHQAKQHNHYEQNFAYVQQGNGPLTPCPTCSGH